MIWAKDYAEMCEKNTPEDMDLWNKQVMKELHDYFPKSINPSEEEIQELYKKDQDIIAIKYYYKDERHSPPAHSNPEDYGLTKKEAWSMRSRYLRARLKPVESSANYLRDRTVRAETKDKWFYMSLWNKENVLVKKLKSNIKYINKLILGEKKQLEPFDIPALKAIPIDTIVEVNRAGKFRVRDEKTPSAHWYKNDNSWVDFGNDNKKHDVIDLIQIIHKCNFIEACKILSCG